MFSLWKSEVKIEKLDLSTHVHFHFDGNLRNLPEPKRSVLSRFQTVIDDHRITPPQLARLVPTEWKWSALTVTDPDHFLGSLMPEQFEWFSHAFRVQRQWLEGASECPALWLDGDRHPEMLLKELEKLGWLTRNLRMTVLADEHNYEQGRVPRYHATMFSHPIAEWDNGETTIFQHAQFGGLWDNGDSSCYMNIMAVARWFCRILNPYGRIPIVPIKPEDLKQLSEMNIHPAKFFTKIYGGYSCLTDHVLYPLDGPNGESASGVGNENLPSIIRYVEECGLLEYQLKSLPSPDAIQPFFAMS